MEVANGALYKFLVSVCDLLRYRIYALGSFADQEQSSEEVGHDLLRLASCIFDVEVFGIKTLPQQSNNIYDRCDAKLQ